MKWLLNSAVIPAGRYGTWYYTPATVGALKGFLLSSGQYESRIGYQQTADVIAAWTGLPAPEVDRSPSDMEPGDIAYVVRLRYRVDPTQKGAPTSTNPADWEIGCLEYTEEA